tara:strand:+ start:196 stop:534 length:339 start_codon:yes stop_codon:yes gene_type:complete
MKTELHSQLIEAGVLSERSVDEGFIVDGNVTGVITVNIPRRDESFMLFQYYFGRVFNIAKNVGSTALVVTLEGTSSHGDWFNMLLNHGLHRSRGNNLRYQISRTELGCVSIG